MKSFRSTEFTSQVGRPAGCVRFAEQGAEVLVFKKAEMNQATDEILDDHAIAPQPPQFGGRASVWK
jgi:hypothetical protein